jgi:hypothetical protein
MMCTRKKCVRSYAFVTVISPWSVSQNFGSTERVSHTTRERNIVDVYGKDGPLPTLRINIACKAF